MKCEYCGRENPDDAVFCECGRPLRLDRSSPPPSAPFDDDMSFAGASAASHRQRGGSSFKLSKLIPIILVVCIVIGILISFLINMSRITNEGSWETVQEPLFTITVPKGLKKDTMLTAVDDEEKILCFYHNFFAGFDVSFYRYKDDEKETFGSFTAKDYVEAYKDHHTTINGQVIILKEREGKNYFYAEYNAHRPNYVHKSKEVYYIEARFPTPRGYFNVNTYCAQSDKEKYSEYMFKWLDSFTITASQD